MVRPVVLPTSGLPMAYARTRPRPRPRTRPYTPRYAGGYRKRRGSGPRRYPGRSNTRARTATGFGGSITPFGRSYTTKCKFTARLPVLAGVNAYETMSLSANNMFDPAGTEGTKQPVGFDELAGIYQQYRVYGCKLKAQFVNTSTTIPVTAGVKVDTLSAAVAYSTIDEMMAAPGMMWKQAPPSGTGPPPVIKRYIPISSAFGVKPSVVQNDDLFAALVSAAPDHQVQINLTTISTDESSVPTGTWLCELTYFCRFFDPKQLALSAA